MGQNKGKQQKGQPPAGKPWMSPVVIIPLIVIILMIIIVIADKARGEKPGEDGTGGEAVTTAFVPETMEAETSESIVPEVTTAPAEETTEPEETDPADAFVTDTFKRDSVPELLDLMKAYFKARAMADAEAMNKLYGLGEVSAGDLEAQKARMRSNSKYVEGFENVMTYVREGTTSDSWLVYAVADIRFHSVQTAAPMIMWCYVMKDAEGNYVIQQDSTLSENVRQFIDVSNHSQEVRGLASSVNVKLKDALNADEELRSVYGVLRDGSPVWQDSDGEPEVVIGGDTAAGDGSEAADATASGDGSAGADASAEAAVGESPEGESPAGESSAGTDAAEGSAPAAAPAAATAPAESPAA